MGYEVQNISVGDASIAITAYVVSDLDLFTRSTTYFDENLEVIGNKFEKFSDLASLNDPAGSAEKNSL
jgi:hypothetical protein